LSDHGCGLAVAAGKFAPISTVESGAAATMKMMSSTKIHVDVRRDLGFRGCQK
jgi:hypothetical protein